MELARETSNQTQSSPTEPRPSALTRAYRRTVELATRGLAIIEADTPAPHFWSHQVRWLVGVVGVTMIVLSAAGIHGYSLPLWHQMLDGSPMTEVLVGKPRPIRSDDYVVDLPWAISQTQVKPRLPAVNPSIGLGQDMQLPNGMPVLGVTMLFRPGTWGFIVGPDVGLGWRWWVRELGLMLAAFTFFYLVTSRRFWMSLFAAAAFVWSPFVQHWSLNNGEIFLFAFLSMAGFIWLAEARSRRESLTAGIFTGWAGTAFGLNIYPPYQVTLAYLILAVAGIFAVSRWRRGGRVERGWLLLAMGTALVVSLVAVGHFYLQVRTTLKIVVNTVYPGHRAAQGGGIPFLEMFDMMLLSPWKLEWGNLGNICEASEFYYVFPLALFLAFGQPEVRRKVLRNPLFWAAASILALLVAWLMVGVPGWLAKVLLLTEVPGVRTHAGMGIPNLLLIVLTLAVLPDRNREPPRWLVTVALGAWMTLILRSGLVQWTEQQPQPKRFLSFFLAWTLAGSLLLRGRRIGLALVAIIGISATFPFNPIVRGGTDFILNNPLSAKMRDLQASDPQARWAVMQNAFIADLPRMLGIPTLDGVQYHPQLDLWRRFDPSGKYMDVYNRYAHVAINSQASMEPVFSTPQGDMVVLSVNPKHPELARLGVRFFLVDGEFGPFETSPDYFKLEFEYAGRRIYRRIGESAGP